MVGNQERIDELEAAAVVDAGRIESLQAAAGVDAERIRLLEEAVTKAAASALDEEAAALIRDTRILGLIAEVEGLQAAMEHRSMIEQAKGVLMHTMGIGPDAAFAVLVAASQRENTKLRDIAERIAKSQDVQPRAERG